MKHLGMLAACAALVLFSCDDELGERIYTEDELGVIIEWCSCGWSDVINETDDAVTLITSYPFDSHEDITSVIAPGDTLRLDIGAAAPGVSIFECTLATIILADGTRIDCGRDIKTPWSEYFLSNYEQEQTYEVVGFDGKKLRHNIVILTYHINNQLIDLFEQSSTRSAPL